MSAGSMGVGSPFLRAHSNVASKFGGRLANTAGAFGTWIRQNCSVPGRYFRGLPSGFVLIFCFPDVLRGGFAALGIDEAVTVEVANSLPGELPQLSFGAPLVSQ